MLFITARKRMGGGKEQWDMEFYKENINKLYCPVKLKNIIAK